MLRILLPADQQEYLIAQPESGMGYQRVEAQINGHWEHGVVFNSKLLVTGEDAQPALHVLKEAAARYKSQIHVTADQPVPIRMAPSNRNSLQEHASAGDGEYTGSAIKAAEEETCTGEVFIRFSAFERDFRITPEGGLVSGSYATTLLDAAECIQTGSDPVERYALPNSDPPQFIFRILPRASTAIKRGIVQPANDQPGGGVEVIFPKGTLSGTVSSPKDISNGVLP